MFYDQISPFHFLSSIVKYRMQIFLKLQTSLYLLIILFLPTQLGKHFWPDFSYVQGIRIDYLSPTIYVTDILLVLLFIVYVFSKIKFNFKYPISNVKFQIKKKLEIGIYWKLVLLVLFLLVGISLSTTPLLGLYGLVKLTEFIFFGYYTAHILSNKKNWSKVLVLLALGVIFESSLAIMQFFQQSSLGGIFYFFGERTFTGQTPGIANASLYGQLVLRPYATLPHPNVLAGYLTIVMTFIIYHLSFIIGNLKKYFLILVLFIGSIALLLTMSRVAILLWVLIVPAFLFRAIFLKKNKTKYFIHNTLYLLLPIIFLGIILASSPLFSRFTSLRLTDETVVVRKELIDASLVLLKENIFFGVGLNNFLPNLSSVPHKTGTVMLLQPVHNILFLIAVETGIVGLFFFFWFLSKTVASIKYQVLSIKTRNNFFLNTRYILLATTLVLGLFDHYFLTLQQGQLLLAFVLGLCWANQKKKKTI